MSGIINYSISIVLPFCNEKNNLEKAINEISKFAKGRFLDYEIILVDDGSTDGSADIAIKSAFADRHIEIITHSKNKGYGTALRSGFKYCSKDIIFFTDSDRQFDIKNIDLLLPHIEKFNIVIGYRKHRKDPILRILLSKGYNILMRLTFGLNLRDIDCAFKLFQGKALKALNIQSQRYSINTEILAKAKSLNYSIQEIAVDHFPRLGDYSKIGIKDIPRTLREVFRIWKSIKVKKTIKI